jgi:hypothetical protein
MSRVQETGMGAYNPDGLNLGGIGFNISGDLVV